MPEFKDWIYYGIYLVGIIVTGIFSYVIWKVTKEGALATKDTADLAKATNDLNKQIFEKDHHSMRVQIKDQLLKVIKPIQDALISTDGPEIDKCLKQLQLSNPISAYHIAKHFNETDANQINWSWAVFEDYKSNYYKDSYKDNEIGLLATHAPNSIIEFGKLIKMLEDMA